MNPSKHVFRYLISFVVMILALFSFLPIYTYFGTYFIKKVCIDDKCYILPKHWIIEVQIKNHHGTYLGIEGLNFKNESIKNMVRLRSNSSGASVMKFNFDINEEFLKKSGYFRVVSNRCVYWRYENQDKETEILIFEENKLKVSVWDIDTKSIKAFQNSFCNPILK